MAGRRPTLTFEQGQAAAQRPRPQTEIVMYDQELDRVAVNDGAPVGVGAVLSR